MSSKEGIKIESMPTKVNNISLFSRLPPILFRLLTRSSDDPSSVIWVNLLEKIFQANILSLGNISTVHVPIRAHRLAKLASLACFPKSESKIFGFPLSLLLFDSLRSFFEGFVISLTITWPENES